MAEEKKKGNALDLIVDNVQSNFSESGSFQLAADIVSAFLSAKSVEDLRTEVKEIIDRYADRQQDESQDEAIDQLRQQVDEQTQGMTDEELADMQESMKEREGQHGPVTEGDPEQTDAPTPQDEAPTEHTIDELKEAMRSGDEDAVSKILDDLRAEARGPQAEAEEATPENPSLEPETQELSKDERYLQRYGEMQGFTTEDFERAAAKSALIADGFISADDLDPKSAVDGIIIQANKLSGSYIAPDAHTARMLRHVADSAALEDETLGDGTTHTVTSTNPKIEEASSYLAQYAEINAVGDGRSPAFDIDMAKDLAAAREAGVDIREIRKQVESQVPRDEHKLAAFDLLTQLDHVESSLYLQPRDEMAILEGASKAVSPKEFGTDIPSPEDGRKPAKFDLSKIRPIVAIKALGATTKDVFAELRENFPKVAADLREHAPEIGAKLADTTKRAAIGVRNGVNTISPTLATGMDQLAERGIAIHNSHIMTAARHGAKDVATSVAKSASGFVDGFKEGLESGKAESLGIDDSEPQIG